MMKLVLVEQVNPNDILDVLKSRLVVKQCAERLAAYYRIARKHDGRIPVTYVKKDSGRYYPDDGFPLYGIYQWRPIRASLYSKQEYDIDAVSCHPTIMSYLAGKFGFSCTYLKEYIRDRTQFIQDLDINTDDLKKYNEIEKSDWSLKDMCKFVFTSSMFGSSIKTIIKTLHMKRSPVRDNSISDKLLTEIRKVSKGLAHLECYSYLKKGVKAVKKGKDYYEGKIVSRIISNIESEVVLELLKTFQKNDIDVTIYMYDGFQVRTDDVELVDDLLEVFNESNQYGLQFIRKQFSRTVKEVEQGWQGDWARSQEEVDCLIRHIENPEIATVSRMLDITDRLPEGVRYVKYDQQYCKPFEEDARCNVVKSDLGSGKSFQVRAMHRAHKPESALFLTPRRIFAKSVKSDFGDEWTLYLDECTKKVLSQPYLICQINSIHKIVREYDYIYVDEIESCLEMLSASILQRKRRDVIETVENLFSKAKRVVLCDADISMRTFDFIAGMGIPTDKIVYEENVRVNRKRDAICVPNDETLLWHFEELIKNGKNVVFFTASKSFLNKHIIPTMTDVLGLSESDYLVYTPDTKNDIKNVEQEWSGKRVIAYTPTITVGVDFNLPNHFDTVLVYAQNYGCGAVRQIFQAMHRVRKIKMDEIYYSIHPKPEPMHRYPFDNYDDAVEYVRQSSELRAFEEEGGNAPDWFRNVHIWNVLESALSKNKYEYVYDYFLQRYGYTKKKTQKQDLSRDDSSEDEDTEVLVIEDFDDIPNIDYEDMLECERLLRRGELDWEKKKAYYKWVFAREFPAVSKQFFPMMMNPRGRHILKRVNWELTKESPSTILRQELNYDYLETVSYDSIILDKIVQINQHLGIEYSGECKEIPLKNFSKPEVLACLSDISRLLSLSKGKKDITMVEHLFKFWNGCSIEPVKAKGGKGIKQRIINGKKEKVYQIVGLEGVKRVIK